MRYIDIESQHPPKEWCEKAAELTEKLKNARTSEERGKIIDDHSLWNDKDIKNWLLKLSYNKCWYTEAREICSFYDVDHFRPKKKAKELDNTEREGYWWLAYDWKNYRISGNVVNRAYKDEQGRTRGKRDYFPIRNGSHIALNPDFDIGDESIYFLDPTDPTDPLLLNFDSTGEALPAARKGSWAYERAKVTIDYLHLDYFLLKDERKKVWYRCLLLVKEIDELMQKEDKCSSPTRNNILRNKMKQLREMISGEAELSSTARACLSEISRLSDDNSSFIAKQLIDHF